MLIGTESFSTVGFDATDSVLPLVVGLWDRAREKVRAIGDDRRYDAQIRIVETDDDGSTSVSHTSAWVEVDDDGMDATGEAYDHAFSLKEGGLPAAMLRIALGQNRELFKANISLMRASAYVQREAMQGHRERIDHDFEMMNRVRTVQKEFFDAQRQFAEEEADGKEIEEWGKTARTFLGNAHLEKMARAGVEAPPIPPSRTKAAKALRLSLTIGQLDAIGEKLGAEKAERLMGMIQAAGSGQLSDEQVEELLASQASSSSDLFELMQVASHVFSNRFVSAAHAVWQTKLFQMVLEGPPDSEESAA